MRIQRNEFFTVVKPKTGGKFITPWMQGDKIINYDSFSEVTLPLEITDDEIKNRYRDITVAEDKVLKEEKEKYLKKLLALKEIDE